MRGKDAQVAFRLLPTSCSGGLDSRNSSGRAHRLLAEQMPWPRKSFSKSSCKRPSSLSGSDWRASSAFFLSGGRSSFAPYRYPEGGEVRRSSRPARMLECPDTQAKGDRIFLNLTALRPSSLSGVLLGRGQHGRSAASRRRADQ